MKFQIGAKPPCAGTVMALPEAVWDSWQRHLGRPALRRKSGRLYELAAEGASPLRCPSTWIYVFDISQTSKSTPNPIVIRKKIASSADAIAHFALKVAPEAAVTAEQGANLIPQRIRQRLASWWPEIAARP
jgi:hypothetical protein